MGDYISNDLMVDVIERLPPKSIIRFRSLSKYWHSRIATPEFVRNHRLRRSKKPHKLIIRHLIYCGKYKFKSIYTLHSGDQLPGCGYIGNPGVEFPYPRRANELVGSCNGILCLYNKEISLWNFSIRRRLVMPRRPHMKSSALGFGFDSVTDDYKIVVISDSDTLIYSLKTDSWTAIPSPSIPFYDLKWKACFFNGILHWVVDGNVNEQESSRFILTFNLSSHVFGKILLPESLGMIRQLTTINGCLALVFSNGIDTLNILTMKEYNKLESWYVSFEFKIKGRDVFRVFQHITNADLLVYNDGSRIYDPKTMALTELARFGPDYIKLEMETYIESLELLDKNRATTCGETIFSWTKTDNRKGIP
ncbi:hypothetical protein QVD17_26273 [Tagetes erecta]|uniref:F-box domain-containing protein n=1 Tax=Tagetes erecta TaxID=13708 RepID=A0AAD8NQN3_TARER|nr:hypothetical protein QVD17_26273 [Tagetes erecta]